MFPFPMLLLTLGNGGVVPLPDGVVKKVSTVQYSTNGIKSSVAVLLNDGRLFTQGDNAYGELADGTLLANHTSFHLAGTDIEDIFSGDSVFVAKFNDGSFKYAGRTAGLTGLPGNATSWTALPSTILSTVPFNLVTEVLGDFGCTLFKLSDGRLYGSGLNANGCLGAGNTNTFSTPRLIASDVKKAQAGWANVSYLSNSGILRVAGSTSGALGTGGAGSTTTFQIANLSTTGETVVIKDYRNTSFQTLVIGSPAGSPVDYMYSRGITGDAYSKMSAYSAGFTDGFFFNGTSASHYSVGGQFLGIGSSNEGVLGADITTKTTVPLVPTYPFTDENGWDVSKINHMAYMHRDSSNQLATGSMFLVYNNNLFITGRSLIDQSSHNGNKFVNINQFNV